MGQAVEHRIWAAIASSPSVFGAGPYVQTITKFDTGCYLYVNDNFVKAAGYAREEVIGKTSIEIGILADKSNRRWLTQILRQHGRLNSKKVRFRLRSGDVRMGLFNAEVIKVDGEDCILSTVTDITEQLAQEDREWQKSCALDLVRDSVVVLDPQGRVTYLNYAAERLYGCRSAEAVGRFARTVLFADNKMAFDAAWRAVREKGEWRGDFVQRTMNGAERSVENRWSVLRHKHSARITSVLVVSSEISKLNETASGLAHEIRNPLASIKGVADAFLQRRQLTGQERQWMEAVRREVLKIDARMRELLDVSQPRIFNAKQCSLNALISGVVLLATQQVRSIKNRQVAVQFIDTTTEPLIMSLDSACIEDAVLNLLLNAIESIEGNGRVTVCLRLGLTNGDGEAMVEITDTGCGIPLEIRRKIFEPRFTTKREGTGLGLAAAQRSAAAHHGRITFTSRIGRGSKFVLTLPLQSQRLTENPK